MAGTSLEHRSAAGDDEQQQGTEVARLQTGELVSYNPDAPSEEWGWHGSWSQMAPRGSRFLLWLGCAGLFLMIFGNQESNVENWWLAVLGTLMAIWLVWREINIRKERARRP